MNKTLSLFTAMTVMILLIACEPSSTAPLYQATAGAAAAQATAAYQATRDTQDNTARSTTDALSAQAQATRQVQDAHATAQAQVVQATAAAVAAQATAQAAAIQATAEARAMNATATTEAWDRQTTATAQSKADSATATAQVIAWEATSTQRAWEGKTTATAEAVQATEGSHHATMTRQAERREETMGYARDYGLPLLLLSGASGLVVFIVYIIRQQAKRPIVYPRSVLGDAEPMAFPRPEGGYTLVDLDRQPGPVLLVGPTGNVDAPQLRDPGQEERTTARDQVLDMSTRPKLGPGHKGGAPPELPLAPPPTPQIPGLRSVRVIRSLPQANRAGLIPPPMFEALAADWEETDD